MTYFNFIYLITLIALSVTLESTFATQINSETQPVTNPRYCLSNVSSIINSQLDKLPRSRISLSFRGYKSNGEMIDLFEKNENDFVVPASNNKILTSAAAFINLTPNYKFRTFLTSSSKNISSLLKRTSGKNTQDIQAERVPCFVFTGDPELSVPNIQTILSKVKLYGKEFILDTDSFFGKESADIYPTWEISDLIYGYGAQPIAASIARQNESSGVTNTFIIEISPGPQVGDKMKISVLEPKGFPQSFWERALPVTFESLTSQQDVKPSLSVECVLGNFGVYIKGSLPIGSAPQRFTVTHSNPKEFSKMLVSYLAQELNLNMIIGKCYQSADPILYQIESRPLEKIMDYTLKESDNTYAELIYRQIGAKYLESTSNAESVANKKVKEIIVTRFPSIKGDTFIQSDGSGLSRWNLVTTDTLATLMREMYTSYPDFINLLPEAGRSGTLISRFKDYPGILKAKTGTLTYATSLSGIIFSNYFEKNIAFSIVVNQASKSSTEIRNIIDNICIVFAFTDPSC